MELKIKKKHLFDRKQLYIFAVLLVVFAGISNAQNVSGTVVADGQPLPGATVLIKGSSKGTSTDFDGNYTIEADAQSILIVSYVGFIAQEILVGSKKQIDVVLEQDNQLDEIVVIGYGTQSKSDLTGAVSSVSSEDIAQVPSARVDQALQGRAAGVQVTQSNGAPGAGTTIRVRGGNSITGSNEPLWVIDGIIVGTDFNLNSINANDIKSIEILKDASSIAIYGSRGANGVVLVTTKSGSVARGGKPQINLGIYTGIQLVPEQPDYLTQPEQIAYTNENARFRSVAEPFPDDPSTYTDTNWFDLLLEASPIYNADVSVAGSSENGNINYYNSLNYFYQDGLIQNSGIDKYIYRSNLDIKLSDKLKAGFRVNYSRIKQNNGTVSYGSLLSSLPTQPIFKEDGSFDGFNAVRGAPFSNPVANAQLNINKTFTNNFLGTVYLEYRPIDNLIVRSTFNPEFNNTKNNRFNSSQRPDFLEVGDLGNARVRTTARVGWNNENTVQYKMNFNDNHSLTALGGASFQKVTNEIAESEAFGITSDATGFNNLGFSDPVRSVVTSEYNGFQIASVFGRLNYAIKDRYLLTLVGRQDGSSVFAEGNKYAFFPSIAGAWKITEEPFMQNQNVFKSLKLRSSYGRAGNQAIRPYSTKSILTEANTTLNGTEVPGLTLGRPANSNLQWETTTSFDVALEASFLGGRIFTEFNYYTKKTNDLLLEVKIPRQTGFDNQLQNIGSLENKGWEVLINSTNVQTTDFNWNSTLTLSSNKNKVLELGGEDSIDLVVDQILGSGNTQIIVGESVPVFTGVRYLGTWKSQEEIDASGLGQQVVGGPRFEDLNGDGIISAEDNVVLGSPQPDLIYGLENTFNYKNLQLSFYLQGTLGNEVYNLRTRTAYFQRSETRKYAELRNRWSPDNPTSDIPRAGSDSVTNIPSNSEYVEDGSHLRLKTVRLAYNLPTERFAGINDMTVYVTGTNLLLLSDFRLIDPETSRFRRSDDFGNIAQGFSNGEYPNPRVLTLGLNVTF